MAMLPKTIRFWLFDKLSLKTMRYVHAVPRSKAKGIVAEVYKQISEDFFINGSLTSRSKVPGLLAAIWTGGRETILVDDNVDRTTKEAIAATLSSINDCPYCGDMLVSLVHAGERADDAVQILNEQESHISDPVLRERLTWVRQVVTPGDIEPCYTPFTRHELPEVIGSIMAMGDVNRFSHIVMDGSPVNAPFGIQRIKQFALGIFGNELEATHRDPLVPGRTLSLLPEASLPTDLQWAKSNTRVAQAIAQWTDCVEKESRSVITENVRTLIHANLSQWHNELMPMSRSWVEQELENVHGDDYFIAKLALLLAKASHQVDDELVETVLFNAKSEEDFIRILAWCSFTASRHVARHVASIANKYPNETEQAA